MTTFTNSSAMGQMVERGIIESRKAELHAQMVKLVEAGKGGTDKFRRLAAQLQMHNARLECLMAN